METQTKKKLEHEMEAAIQGLCFSAGRMEDKVEKKRQNQVEARVMRGLYLAIMGEGPRYSDMTIRVIAPSCFGSWVAQIFHNITFGIVHKYYPHIAYTLGGPPTL